MKRLYLQYLNLRVWFLRRRLREMGFREVADQTTAETLLRLQMEATDTQRLFLDCIKIGLMVLAVVSLWLILGLRLLEPIQIVVPLPERPPSSLPLPDAGTPANWNFVEPFLPLHTV
jgi:hypothetical protein